MPEGEISRMELERTFRPRPLGIKPITANRHPGKGEMDPDLVGAASFESADKHCSLVRTANLLEMGDGGPSVVHDRHDEVILLVSTDRSVDGELVVRRVTPSDAEIAPLCFPGLNLLRQSAVRRVVFGDKHESRRVFVEPVDDSGPETAAVSAQFV